MQKFDSTTALPNYDVFKDTLLQDGFNVVAQKKITFKDIFGVTNASVWMPQYIEEVMREPVEPMLIVTKLFDQIAYQPGMKITTGGMGSLVAFDMADAQSYAEQPINIIPGSVTANVGKVGLMFKLTEEQVRYSQFDVMNTMLRKARQALDRHKEKKAMDMLSGMGTTLFNNKQPTRSVYGTCTGRSLTGAGNGSCRMEDLLTGYSHILMQGYTPDTILLHPLHWSMWMSDPYLKAIAINTGNGKYFQPFNAPKAGTPWSKSSQSKMGMAGGYGQYTPGGNAGGATPTSPTNANGFDQTLNTPAVIPSYFPFPLQVIVSPFVPFDEVTKSGDIIIFDSSNLGALLTDELPKQDQTEDWNSDLIKVKLRERYCFSIYEDGLAVGIMRSVPVRANEIASYVTPSISVSGSLSDLDVTSPISF